MYFSENLTRVFSKPGNDFDGFKKMFKDYIYNEKIYDEDGNEVSKSKVNDKINQIAFDILQLDPNKEYRKKDYKRAMKKHGIELFEVIEEAIDMKISTGLQDNEYFNELVDPRNISNGDRNDFWVDKDVILTVAKVSGDHHDISLQKLAEGETFSVKTSNYAVKVGMDIDLYLTGRRDWSKLVDAVSRAYQQEIQNTILSELMAVGTKIPYAEQFHKTMELSAANKDTFDQLLEDVSAANDGVDVMIVGLKTDLKKLNALTDVDWITDRQKEDVAAFGRLGSYEGNELIEIPQRFVKNDPTKKLITPGTILILPNVDNKFIKFVDVGDTEIVEVTEKGEYNDDFMTYEVQREMGVASVFDRAIGCWTIA